MERKYTPALVIPLMVLLFFACNTQGTSSTAEASMQSEEDATTSTFATTDMQAESVTLDPSKGEEIGFVYEAFLSPHQEPGEEEDTPRGTPEEFRSTEPSVSRNERTSRGHGMIRFTNDLSRAYVDVAFENVDPEKVVMFHVHCGRPDQLGPIIIDFALSGDLQENMADGTYSVTLTDEDVEEAIESGEGLIGAFTRGCPITQSIREDDHKTIAGMQYIAQKGDLYFNLHTSAQTYYGDIRGRLIPVSEYVRD